MQIFSSNTKDKLKESLVTWVLADPEKRMIATVSNTAYEDFIRAGLNAFQVFWLTGKYSQPLWGVEREVAFYNSDETIKHLIQEKYGVRPEILSSLSSVVDVSDFKESKEDSKKEEEEFKPKINWEPWKTMKDQEDRKEYEETVVKAIVNGLSGLSTNELKEAVTKTFKDIFGFIGKDSQNS